MVGVTLISTHYRILRRRFLPNVCAENGLPFGNSFASSSLVLIIIKKQSIKRYSVFLGRSDFDFHSLSKPPPEVSPKRLRRKRLAVWKLVRKFKSYADYNKKNRVSKDTLFFLVGVTRLELATPRPPVWCATTCATPRTQCFNTITQHLQ